MDGRQITKIRPGELGADFWIRMIGVGAVPVFSLLATSGARPESVVLFLVSDC